MKLLQKMLLSTSVMIALLLPSVAFAQSTSEVLQGSCTGAAANSDYCKNFRQQSGENRIIGPNGIITRIAQFFVFLTAAVSVVMIVIGGLRYVLSGGDSNATKGAKDTIMYAVIGLVVGIFSQIIVTFVLARL